MTPGRRALMVAALLTAAVVGLLAGTTRWGDPPLPPGNGRVSYQLGGAYPPAPGVTVVVRDRADPPVPGTYGICYLNAFQTQPGASWPDGLVLDVEDPDWPGEFLLDTSTAARRERILAVIGGWIDGCARDGFAAVELDNLDSWTRSGGALGLDDNLALAERLVERAHARGLAVAHKNAPELLAAAEFDFAVLEQCQAQGECAAFLDVYGDAVIVVEYDARAFTAACAALGDRIAVLLRDPQLVPAGAPGHVDRAC